MKNATTRRRTHGTGSVKALGGGRYRIGYQVITSSGERKYPREVIRAASKGEAETVLDERQVALAKGGFTGNSQLTFGELAQRFITDQKIRCGEGTTDLHSRLLRTTSCPFSAAPKSVS